MHADNLVDNSPLLEKIVTRAEQRGLRLSEFFRDFDKVNHGECPSSALNCISTQLNLGLATNEVEELIETYPSKSPGFFDYRRFLGDAKKLIFASESRSNRPVGPRTPSSKSRIERSRDSHFDNSHVISLIQAQVYEKRVSIREFFRDFDQLRKGLVADSKLRCVLSLLNIEITEAEVTSLVKTYGTSDKMIDYLRLCSDVERDLVCPELEMNPSGNPPPPFDLYLAKEGKKPTLSGAEMDVISETEEMIRRMSRQHGVNLLPPFRDFDRYNRLVITDSQFKRTMKTLGFEISELEYDIILKKYCIHGSPHRFAYREFCRSIESP